MPNGLDYFGARHHAPAFGRFMQPDPAGSFAVDPGNPQSWHLYNYVWNNPFAYVDPTGLDVAQVGNCYWNTRTDPETGQTIYVGPPVCGGQGSGSDSGGASATPDSHPSPSVPQTKQSLGCSVAKPLLSLAHVTGGTLGLGVGGSVAVGFGIGGGMGLGVQLVADPNGNLGIAINLNMSPGIGVFGASAMVGGQVSASTSKSIFGPTGWSLAGDISVGAGPAVDLGVSNSFSSWLGPMNGPTTVSATVGPGVGTKAAVAAVGYSWVPKSLSVNCGR